MAIYSAFPEFDEVRHRWGWFLALGVILIVLGVIALVATFLVTLASILFLGWLLIISGVVQLVHAFQPRGWNGVFLHVLSGIIAIVAGILLVADPRAGALALTLLLAAYFLVSGAFRVVAALMLRFPNWGWAIFSGVISLILGALIWGQWPASAVWFIGLAVGIDLIFHGWGWVAFALAARTGVATRA